MTSASVLLQGLEWGRSCSQVLSTMREEGLFCDVTIIGSDALKLQAHSCVLGAASPILKGLLAKRKGQKIIRSEISCHLWEMILKFVYTSEVLVPLDDIMSLKDIHNAAKALGMVGLRDAAKEFISEEMLLMSQNELNKPGPMSPGFHSIVSLSFGRHPLENVQYEKTGYCRGTQTLPEGEGELEVIEDDDDEVTEIKIPVNLNQASVRGRKDSLQDLDEDLMSSSDESQPPTVRPGGSAAADRADSEESMVAGESAATPAASATPDAAAATTSVEHLIVPTSSSTPDQVPIDVVTTQAVVPSETVPITVAPHNSVTVENGQILPTPEPLVIAGLTQDISTVDTSALGIKQEGDKVGDGAVGVDVLDAAMREIGELSVSEDEQEDMPGDDAARKAAALAAANTNRRVKLIRNPGCYRPKSPVDKSAPVYCPVCNKLLKNGAHSLNAHMTVHRKENPLKCDWCDFTTHKEGEFRKHKATHTGEKAFKCDQCSYSTNRPHDLKMHMKRHAGEKPYGCKSCGKTFVKKSELKTHMMTHSGEKPHQCDYCEKSFRRRYDLSSHLLTHTDEKPYCCELCKNTFKRKKELEDHIATVHIEVTQPEGEPEPFRCRDCGFTAKSKRSLQAHVAASHSDAGFKCERCHKTFKTKPMYLSHLKSHTGRPYECQHCGEDQETQLRLKAHLADKHGETISKLTCALCDKDYPNKNAFNTHMHKVHRKNPYMCHICGAIFKYAVNLRTHEMFHRGEKPYGCNDCGKRFTQKLDLKRHKMVHTGEKPFLCTYCPFATTRKGYLKIHEMSHTGLKPHICNICNERFKIRSDLKIHMKKLHGIDIPMKVSRLKEFQDGLRDGIKQEDDDEDEDLEDDEEIEAHLEDEMDEYTFRDDEESNMEVVETGAEVHFNNQAINMEGMQVVEVPSMEGVVAAQQVVYQEGDIPDAKSADAALQMAEEAAMQQYTVALAAESLAELSQYVTPEHLTVGQTQEHLVVQQHEGEPL